MAGEEKDFLPDVKGSADDIRRELEERANKYLYNWQRSEADFINYKKRAEQEKADIIRSANTSLIADILPVLDDFERALSRVLGDRKSSDWLEGVRLIYLKLKSILEARGVSVIEAEGKGFDPNIHEAVMCVEGEDGVCIEEIQKGYKLGDRLLRPARVKVGKQGSPEIAEDRE